jgi:hypothetical protein
MSVNDIPSPEQFFGFRMGTDRKLARWDKIVDYYRILDERSDKIKVMELGKSTEGNPFLLAIVSSPENMGNLDTLKTIGPTLAYSEELPQEDVERLVNEGKAVLTMSMSIHANEVGGTQMAPELVHELITCESPEIQKILDEVVLLLVPCANPDGNLMVVDWYNEWLDTEYEGVNLPWLYHKYVGHDNNRDLVLLNMVETRMMAKILFEEWFPVAFIDYHHYGSYGGRYYIPPFVNPTDPNVDPLIWTEQQLYGGAMINRLELEGCVGVENYAGFTAEFNSTYTRVCGWHGICGMLTESASAKLATPLYIHYHQLQPARRGRPEYRSHVNFPHPWPGGWWRLRNIVDQQKVSALAALELVANYRETFLRNLRMKAERGIEKGKTKPPYALVFPPNQWDTLTAGKLFEALKRNGVKIHRAEEGFEVDGVSYPVGSHIVYFNQITRPFLLSLLMDKFYHDNPWARNTDGTPLGLQDLAGYNLAAMMGVQVIEVRKPFDAKTTRVEEVEHKVEPVTESKHGYILDGRQNDSFKAANSLLKDKIKVYRVVEEATVGGETMPVGAFYIPDKKGTKAALEAQIKELHINVYSLEAAPGFEIREVQPLKVAIYQRYWGGNMDEGWTRWILEQYGFDYSTVKDEEIKGGLEDKYDVLIFPGDPDEVIRGEKIEEYYEKRYKGMITVPKFPPEYRSGIGEEGTEKVKEFIENGGTLLLLNESCGFGMETLKLPMMNTVKDLKPNEFFCPGSLLKAQINTRSPLAYGVEEGTPVLFWDSPVMVVKSHENNQDFDVVVRYQDENILQSGWLIGEKNLGRKAALVDVKRGKGRVVLYGFRSQFRAQTHATFKFLFNALYS